MPIEQDRQGEKKNIILIMGKDYIPGVKTGEQRKDFGFKQILRPWAELLVCSDRPFSALREYTVLREVT